METRLMETGWKSSRPLVNGLSLHVVVIGLTPNGTTALFEEARPSLAGYKSVTTVDRHPVYY